YFEAVEGWRRSNRRLLPHPISHGRIALPRQPRTRPDVKSMSDNTDGIIIASIVQFCLHGAGPRPAGAPSTHPTWSPSSASAPRFKHGKLVERPTTRIVAKAA